MNSTDDLKVFQQNLISLVEKNYQTTSTAAEAIRYDRGALSKLLYSQKNFKLETLLKIAKTFDVSVYLLFSRLFAKYKDTFHYVEADYMEIIRTNFYAQSRPQSYIQLDPTTVSHILNGRRKNITIKTISKIAAGASISISDLLKTQQDVILEKKLLEEENE